MQYSLYVIGFTFFFGGFLLTGLVRARPGCTRACRSGAYCPDCGPTWHCAPPAASCWSSSFISVHLQHHAPLPSPRPMAAHPAPSLERRCFHPPAAQTERCHHENDLQNHRLRRVIVFLAVVTGSGLHPRPGLESAADLSSLSTTPLAGSRTRSCSTPTAATTAIRSTCAPKTRPWDRCPRVATTSSTTP